jgi:hypothetical protein
MFITLWFGFDYGTNPFIFVHAFGSDVFMQENMDIKDGVTTSSKEHVTPVFQRKPNAFHTCAIITISHI